MSVPPSTFTTDEIVNNDATEDTKNRYNICQRTGFRVKPGTLVREWNGTLVRPDSWEQRHPQEFIRPLAEDLKGARRPEPDDEFVTTAITADDL